LSCLGFSEAISLTLQDYPKKSLHLGLVFYDKDCAFSL
jgi:hypothetical protein